MKTPFAFLALVRFHFSARQLNDTVIFHASIHPLGHSQRSTWHAGVEHLEVRLEVFVTRLHIRKGFVQHSQAALSLPCRYIPLVHYLFKFSFYFCFIIHRFIHHKSITKINDFFAKIPFTTITTTATLSPQQQPHKPQSLHQATLN